LDVYFDALISAADWILTVFISLGLVFPFVRLVGVHAVRYTPQSTKSVMLCFYVSNNAVRFASRATMHH